ncbi:Growth/differentiation factor 8 [Trachymyrmex zeteki]|uniref:Growth/differentiation factor 8 n=1 Tax=Mycetomoellerius zeteki TaxID=64791 RepID=A0A151X7Z8_9HYME|nr:PREDICTED: growth/differentiation factor 8 [Trachymyrmex zeteki]KYQ56505.1 Growth/differentiation factor 8 [Trachymyrmex zeteki]
MVTRALLLLSLVLLDAFDAPGIERAHVRHLAMAGNACNACRMHEEIRALSLEAIKEQILNKLGLKQAPNMTGRALPRIPPISKLMDMYGMQADQPLEPGITHHEEVDEYAAKTESVFALAQPHQRLRHSKSNSEVLYFKFSDKIVQHRVTRAELSLWIWGVNQETELGEPIDQDAGPVTITLHRILRRTTETGEIVLGPPLTTKHPRPFGRRGGWITIELRRMVAEWFKHPRDNLGVALKITGSSHRKNSIRLVETNPGAEYAPYLEVQMQELDSRRGSRIKRNVGLNCDEASQETRCCRYKLTVDFEKFGWDWIIAPKKYDANYCSGDCPMAFLPAYPNTHIVSLAEPPNNTGPCCAPRKLSEITMLYFDNEYQIVFSRLPGMVVEKCGCS